MSAVIALNRVWLLAVSRCLDPPGIDPGGFSAPLFYRRPLALGHSPITTLAAPVALLDLRGLDQKTFTTKTLKGSLIVSASTWLQPTAPGGGGFSVALRL